MASLDKRACFLSLSGYLRSPVYHPVVSHDHFQIGWGRMHHQSKTLTYTCTNAYGLELTQARLARSTLRRRHALDLQLRRATSTILGIRLRAFWACSVSVGVPQWSRARFFSALCTFGLYEDDGMGPSVTDAR